MTNDTIHISYNTYNMCISNKQNQLGDNEMKTNMLFAPKEQGQSLVEVAVILGILAVIFKVIVTFWTKVSATECGVFESCFRQ